MAAAIGEKQISHRSRPLVTGRNLAPINGCRSWECGGEEESRHGFLRSLARDVRLGCDQHVFCCVCTGPLDPLAVRRARCGTTSTTRSWNVWLYDYVCVSRLCRAVTYRGTRAGGGARLSLSFYLPGPDVQGTGESL